MISESVLKKSSVLLLELSPKVKDNLTRNDVNRLSHIMQLSKVMVLLKEHTDTC